MKKPFCREGAIILLEKACSLLFDNNEVQWDDQALREVIDKVADSDRNCRRRCRIHLRFAPKVRRAGKLAKKGSPSRKIGAKKFVRPSGIKEGKEGGEISDFFEDGLLDRTLFPESPISPATKSCPPKCE